MRRAILALGLLVAELIAPIEGHATSHVETLTLLLVRTTSGPSQFNISLTAYAPKEGAFVGDIDVVARRGRVVQTVSGSMGGLQSERDGASAGPIHFRTCRAMECGGGPEGLVGAGIGYSSRHSRGDVNLLFLVLHGDDVSYKFEGSGWRVVSVPLTYRTVDTWDTSPVRISSGVYSAAVVVGARAMGGDRGSVALAAPPCSISLAGVVSRGVGKVRLTGGATRPEFTCPIDRIPMGSYSNHKTTWSVDGRAAGDSTQSDTTLFVIDRPARLPHAAP